MKIRLVLTLVVGIVIGILLNPFIPPVVAQNAPSLRDTTRSGFSVEEVRVGSSCVVLVWRGGVGDDFQAVPC